MSDAYLGDIKLVGFGFAPRGWALCNGQLMQIMQNQPLFSLLGTTYGGDGRVSFGLPNLQGRIPLHAGGQYGLGQQGGEAQHTLTPGETPIHTHPVLGTTATGTLSSPVGALMAGSAQPAYGSKLDTEMNPGSISPVGSSQPHPNMPPFLVVNFIICLSGIYPSRN